MEPLEGKHVLDTPNLARNPEWVSMLWVLLSLAWNPEKERMLSILVENLA
jgi:hypothetical protein